MIAESRIDRSRSVDSLTEDSQSSEMVARSKFGSRRSVHSSILDFESNDRVGGSKIGSPGPNNEEIGLAGKSG